MIPSISCPQAKIIGYFRPNTSVQSEGRATRWETVEPILFVCHVSVWGTGNRPKLRCSIPYPPNVNNNISSTNIIPRTIASKPRINSKSNLTCKPLIIPLLKFRFLGLS